MTILIGQWHYFVSIDDWQIRKKIYSLNLHRNDDYKLLCLVCVC